MHISVGVHIGHTAIANFVNLRGHKVKSIMKKVQQKQFCALS